MFLLIIILFVVFYIYGTKNYGYWKGKGIKHDRPLPFFGNALRNFLQRATTTMLGEEMYKKYPEEKVVGFYSGSSPVLILRDRDIIKRILTTDFHHFHSRGITLHKTAIEPLLRNISFADGDTWYLLRSCFTPAFSPGKMKALFPIIMKKSEKLQTVTEEIALIDSYDILELLGNYTTELMGVCAFGVDIDCMRNGNSILRQLAKRIVTRNFRDGTSFALKSMFPELCKNIELLGPDLKSLLCSLVQTVLKERNHLPSNTNDFIDLLLQIKRKGKIIADSLEAKAKNEPPKKVDLELDDITITAQAGIFFTASFETSATAIGHTLHQLAFHPDCQKKAQEEIDQVLPKYNNKITYAAIKELKYLEMVFCESLRLFPSVAHLLRKCTSPVYTIPEINLEIKEGVRIIVPVKALHMDENYFSEPHKFDPDRFHPSRKGNWNYIYMPFGGGPRQCVGEALGELMSLAGIVAILQKFTVEPAANSLRNPLPKPQEYLTESFLGGLPLKLKKRQQY